MHKISINKEGLINSILILYATVLPLGFALANIFLVVFLAVFFLMIITRNVSVSKNKTKWVLIYSTYFIVLVLSLFYTENINLGIAALVRKSPIVIFACGILFLKEYINPKYIIRIFYGYTISIIFVSIVSIAISWSNCFENNLFITIECLSGQNLASSFITYHKLYMSLYVAIGIYFTNYILFKEKIKYRVLLKIISNVVLATTLILLGSRTMLAITLVYLIIIPQLMWFKERKYLKIILSFFFVLVIGGLNFKYNPILVDKVKESINYNNEYGIKKKWGGAAVRLLIWEYAYYVVKDNLLIGVGVGDTQAELNSSYENCVKSSALKQTTYNAHNDLLQMLVTTGLLGILFYGMSYGYIFKISFLEKNFLHCGFLFLFFCSGLTESYLERDMGIRVFAFFSPILFIINKLNEGTSNTQ